MMTIAHLVTLFDFSTVHSDPGRTIHGDGQDTDSSVAGVDDEVGLHARLHRAKTRAVDVDCGGIRVILSDLECTTKYYS